MNQTIRQIEFRLSEAMASERLAIGREIARIRQIKTEATPDEKVKQKLLNLEQRLQASIQKKAWRRENRPEPADNPALPIMSKKAEIIRAVTRHPVVIISGETGSGKTTQIPKFCLAAGRGIDGKIGCTQPRRIAATTVSRRIAEELGEDLGRSVGYKIRFRDKTSPDGFIKIMTDGILLAETQGDPLLTEYDTIIVDEAHERSLNIDFILGFLKMLLKKRNDLKVVITSATIDTEKFSNAFDRAPVVEVSGRMYPVEVRYLSAEPKAAESDESGYVETAVRAVDDLQRERSWGDILIFMPTEQDIREACEMIQGRKYKNTTVLPLYARLTAAEQTAVFARMPARKIIIATNIAETSITIPGIQYVIDTGLARISQYTPRTRTTSLPVTAISQSSAQQRQGRCGRVEKGVCIRLFSEEDFKSRPLFTPPEILRANLADVILRMIALKLGDVADFPFVDRPDIHSIRDGFDLLVELGAITPSPSSQKARGKPRFKLTQIGKLMAKMPVDPRLSRMLIESQSRGCLQEMTVIAAALSIQDVRERPTDKAEQADQIHRKFQDPASDFVTLLNIWNQYHQNWDTSKSTAQNFKQVKKFCQAHFLSFKRMREWIDIHSQLAQILREYRLHDRTVSISEAPFNNASSEAFSPRYAAIHQSILSGFLSNIGLQKEKNFFQAAKGREVMIFPGSTLFNRAKNWIVAAEMVETTRLFARTNANIDSHWLEALGKNLCKYTYLDPHWERKPGQVTAYEQVSLFGLIIVSRRPVSYGRIKPQEASEIFIRSALVEGDLRQRFAFMEHNRKVIAEVRDMEERIRRRDILVSEDQMFTFYRKRLKGCYDNRTLERKIKQKGGDLFLRMTPEDVRRYLPDTQELDLFPKSINLGNLSFNCTYKFEPGKTQDGVTVKIPSSYASQVPVESMDWLVPGLLREKISALVKGLPKTFRKQLVPISRTVDAVVNEMPKQDGSLITALGRFIYQRFGIDIPASAWPEEVLSDHLKMRIAVTGPLGEEMRTGRDPAILRAVDQGMAGLEDSEEMEAARNQWEKTGITRWDFADLPETISIKSKTVSEWLLYPGLEKEPYPDKKSVRLRLFQRQEEALRAHREGVAALFCAHLAKDLKFLKKSLALPSQIQKLADYFGGSRRFEKSIYDTVIHTLFHKNIRSQDAFYALAESTAPTLLTKGRELLDKSVAVLETFHETRSVLYNLETSHSRSTTVMQFLKSLREELNRLVPETFVRLYAPERLVNLPRYIKAVAVRAERALLNFEKDQAKAREIQMFTDKLDAMLKELSPQSSPEKRTALEAFFWLIEEYKVSLFAQELKTAVPVSQKRLEHQLKEIERMA